MGAGETEIVRETLFLAALLTLFSQVAAPSQGALSTFPAINPRAGVGVALSL